MKDVIHCNVKQNAELIARILDYDVDNTEHFVIEKDGTLCIDLPIDIAKVNRVNIYNSETNVGNLYYSD